MEEEEVHRAGKKITEYLYLPVLVSAYLTFLKEEAVVSVDLTYTPT